MYKVCASFSMALSVPTSSCAVELLVIAAMYKWLQSVVVPGFKTTVHLRVK